MAKREDIVFSQHSTAFSGSNSQKKVKDLYASRVRYRDADFTASDGQQMPLIDLWNDKTMYGRVNTTMSTVWPSETNLVMLTDTCAVLDFVAVAFSDFNARWNELKSLGVITPVGPFNELIPFHGWISTHEKYHVYIEKVFSDFQTWVRSGERDTKMLTFRDFLNQMCAFVADMSPHTPFSRTSFLRSIYSDICSSGLNLELEHVGVSHDDDKAKYTTLLKDENFEAFALLAKQYGFYIDKNAPWRLIANVNSEPMKKYMLQFGLTSTENMFRTYYYVSYHKDLDALKPYLVGMWNSFATAFPYQRLAMVEDKGNGLYATRGKLYQRKTVSSFHEVSDVEWHKMYFYIRAKEAGLHWSQTKFDYHLKEVVNIYRTTDIKTTVEYIESLVGELIFPGGNPELRKQLDNRGDERYNVRNSTGEVGDFRLITTWK